MKKKVFGFLFCLFFISFSLHAIYVINHTYEPFFVAAYSFNEERAVRCADTFCVAPWDTQEIECNENDGVIRILFSENKKDLPPIMDKDGHYLVPHRTLSWLTNGNYLYVARFGGYLTAYTPLEWTYYRPLVKAYNKLSYHFKEQLYELLFGIRKYLSQRLAAIQDNPYKDMPAQVRVGNQLCAAENAWIEKRHPKVKTAIEKLIGYEISDEQVPTIALVSSGGGYRALIATIGSLIGVEKIGLLDTVMYLGGVSGSTWAIGSWISSEQPVEEFKTQLLEKVDDGLVHIDIDGAQLIAEAILVKYICDQPVTLIDFYGGLLANTLLRDFGDMRQQISLSSQQNIIKEGDYPLPIYNAVRGDKYAAQNWYEFTPYEIGGAWLGAYVPTWAFGRFFEGGISRDTNPEQTLGYHFGMYGSGFAARLDRLYEEMRDSITSDMMRTIIQKLLDQVGEKRLVTGKVHNFTANMPKSSIITDQKSMRIVDAGMEVNIAYPPISGERAERTADIIICLDISSDAHEATNLYRMQNYALERSLPFPPISGIPGSNTLNIFKDEHNTNVPLVIYMPLIRDNAILEAMKDQFPELIQKIGDFNPIDCSFDTFCSTLDFSYTFEQSEMVSSLAELNMRVHAQHIIEAIKYKIEQIY